MTAFPLFHWTDANGVEHADRWRSEAGVQPPRRAIVADDRTSADAAYRLACEGTALVWQGDFQNARQLLQALARRIDRKPRKPAATGIDAFNLHRLAQAQRARILGMLLIPLEADYSVALRRAPDLRAACEDAYGAPDGARSVASLRELLGIVGSHEWRKKGVPIAALGGARIHPHYGVFSPVRGEYVELVARAPLPPSALAFDIGTGTGVIAAVLASRGVQRVVATDQDPRALACAAENVARLGYAAQVEIVKADLFPAANAPHSNTRGSHARPESEPDSQGLSRERRAALIVCNPPWVPARPSSPLEYAVYDPDSRMLKGFLAGLAAHLAPGGEGWLILSDFAEHLGLRTRDELLGWIDAAGLRVVGRDDAKPVHPKASDPTDPLHRARAAETTSLWRLGARN
ncbi:methyltransferase [Burkholderia sp. TSV86]|uniref:methyltransferase n=1 Tax=Burkholderia sp. TSV86 TaxID=1385594 RepID=UPI0007594BD4|nr:class I SAM-dependent methyltransferase [Burkholderia sp. TSV86]KVE34678.1 methylase [Burkholderia sp. TSV86]